MLPKKERLTTLDFAKLRGLKFNKLIVNYGFFVIYPLGKDEGEIAGKKGIILSKKNYKTAVSRNEAKRLFYNTLASAKKDGLDYKDIHLVFHPKKTFTKDELLMDLRKIK